MKLWLRLAWREVKADRALSLFLVLNLALGLTGFLALDSFKTSLAHHIQGQSRVLLAADISLSAFRPLSEADLAQAEAQFENPVKARQVLFNSMVAGPAEARLAEVNAVEPGYPFYGELVLADGRRLTGLDLARLFASSPVTARPVALVQTDLLEALQLKVGQEIRLGGTAFTIAGAVTESPGQSFWNASLSHKIFIALPQAEQSGLLGFGAYRRFNYLYKLPPGADAAALADQINQAANQAQGGSAYFEAKSHDKANPQMSRLLDYLGDYLGLAALVALFLAGLGTAYLVRGFLAQKYQEMAILRSLGALPRDTSYWVVALVLLLGLGASLLAGLLALAVLPALGWILQGITPVGFAPRLQPASLLMAAGIGLCSSLLFVLPLLVRLTQVRPSDLFHQAQGLETTRLEAKFVLALAPLALFFWGMSLLQANSLRVGSIFFACLLASGLALAGWGRLSLWGLGRLRPRGIKTRLVLRNLSRGGVASLASFVAIGLGATLINLIPQLEQGLQAEIRQPESSALPSFFLFDVQPEQVDPLKAFVASQGQKLEKIYPSVSARITGLKGQPWLVAEGRSREAQQQAELRRYNANLSMRGQLYESETLLAGKFPAQAYHPESGQPPEISLEARYAERLGLQLGDSMEFDVLGVPLQGRVTSLRQVKWNSFEPNFFIVFQPGSLEGAPATWLGVIGPMAETDKNPLQQAITRTFTNVSMIHVSQMVGRILNLSQQVSLAIRAMAVLAMLAGLVVVFSIARHQALTRAKEINLLKTLGAEHGALRAMFLAEFGLLGFLASLTGCLISLGLASLLSQWIFQRHFQLFLAPTLVTLAATTALSGLLAAWGAKQVLARQPIELLKAL